MAKADKNLKDRSVDEIISLLFVSFLKRQLMKDGLLQKFHPFLYRNL